MQVLGIGPEPGIALAKGVQFSPSAGRVANGAWSRLACPVFLGPEHQRDRKPAEKHNRKNLEDFGHSILQPTGVCSATHFAIDRDVERHMDCMYDGAGLRQPTL
jgi:hypothetical protein